MSKPELLHAVGEVARLAHDPDLSDEQAEYLSRGLESLIRKFNNLRFRPVGEMLAKGIMDRDDTAIKAALDRQTELVTR